MSSVKTEPPRSRAVGRALALEEAAFRKRHADLLRRYKGQFVGVYHGRVVAHGVDDEELAQSMFAKLGDAPFLIAKVEPTERILEIPSPESVS